MDTSEADLTCATGAELSFHAFLVSNHLWLLESFCPSFHFRSTSLSPQQQAIFLVLLCFYYYSYFFLFHMTNI